MISSAERFKNLWWASLTQIPPTIEHGGEVYNEVLEIFRREVVLNEGNQEKQTVTVEFKDGSGIRFSLIRHDDGSAEIGIAIKDPRPEGGG